MAKGNRSVGIPEEAIVNKIYLIRGKKVMLDRDLEMLSSVLNSETAIEVNIRIIRVFTKMRELLLTHKDILVRLEQVEKETGRRSCLPCLCNCVY
jgi:hypothetical protein